MLLLSLWTGNGRSQLGFVPTRQFMLIHPIESRECGEKNVLARSGSGEGRTIWSLVLDAWCHEWVEQTSAYHIASWPLGRASNWIGLPWQIPIAWPEVISGWIICFGNEAMQKLDGKRWPQKKNSTFSWWPSDHPPFSTVSSSWRRFMVHYMPPALGPRCPCVFHVGSLGCQLPNEAFSNLKTTSIYTFRLWKAGANPSGSSQG